VPERSNPTLLLEVVHSSTAGVLLWRRRCLDITADAKNNLDVGINVHGPI